MNLFICACGDDIALVCVVTPATEMETILDLQVAAWQWALLPVIPAPLQHFPSVEIPGTPIFEADLVKPK